MLGERALLRRRLINWYRRNRRDLPWRVALGSAPGWRPDPYHVLISEAMLQQTQVRTVIPYFIRFTREFPTIQSLAAADEQHVLRLWQGLGYYTRARNLLAAARAIVRDFGGHIPASAEQLRSLPGVGRYTAGAVASLAFDQHEPIVDGNVARVICRIDRIEGDARERPTRERLWTRATQLLPSKDVGDFNSALMELGATLCLPKLPRCAGCPISRHCEALAAGVQGQIPRPRPVQRTPLLRRRTYCIRRSGTGGERWLIEQRPPTGRWAGMWQFITLPAPAPRPAGATSPRKLATVQHTLTHRRYRFDVYICDACNGFTEAGPSTRWVRLSELDRFPLPRPQLKIAGLLLHPPSPRRGNSTAPA